MGMSAFRKMVSCVLLSMLPGSLLAADSGAAMLYAHGAAWLNGAHVPTSSAIFTGDLVQTRSDSGANINAPGSSITVLGESLVQFEGASLKVEHGGVSVSTSKGVATTAGDVRVAPVSNAWTEFNVTDTDGTVRIAALKGDLTVTDDNGTVTLPQGQQTTRDEQSSDQSDKSTDKDKKKNKKRAAGAAPAAGGGILSSPIAIGIGAAAIGGVTAWVLIKSDNPYLDPTIAARMATLGITSFTTSNVFADGVNMAATKFSDFYNTVGAPVGYGERQLYRGVLTLDGALGDDWSWNAAVQHSESHLHEIGTHNLIKANLTLATDAVRVTAANAGASGLTVGTIACRSTLTAPLNGCVPLDVLGTGVQNPAAVAYVNTNNNWQFQNEEQDTFDASMQGKLPWDVTGAGVPSVAFGADYRKEQVVGTTNPTSTALGYAVANFQPVLGEFNVEEGFAEIDAPLIKDGIVENLSVNAAGRFTSYSTSGAVQTWKLGATSQVNDDVRLRTTWSLDIRAPNLGELFSQVPSAGNPLDPKTGKAVTTALQITANNPNLQPEKAITVSGGVVLTPHWVPGLSMSFDWYSIGVHGFVATPNGNLEEQLCLGGSAAACANYVYSGSNLTAVYLRPLNAASMTTSGLDFNADYAMDLFSGNLALHLTGNYVDEQTESAFGTAPYDFAGAMGSDSQYAGLPKMHFTFAATYNDGPWSATAQTRYIGSARLNNYWQTGVQVDNNAVSAVAYLDLRGTYKWNDKIQFYGSVDNTLDSPPPEVVGTNTNNLSLNTATAGSVYDTLGRLYHVGIRFSY